MIKLDEIYKIFLGSDDLREWMMQPNEFDGCVYATDAHALIKAPKDLFKKEYPPHQKTANFNKLYENYVINEKPLDIFISRAKELFLNIEKVDDEDVCSECRGEGQVTCNYDCQHDCPECDGTGLIRSRTGKKIYPKDDHYIRIANAYFAPFYLDKLVQVCDFLGKETVKLVCYGELKSHLFRFEKIDVVIMPINRDNVDDFEDKKTHVLNIEP